MCLDTKEKRDVNCCERGRGQTYNYFKWLMDIYLEIIRKFSKKNYDH